MTKFLFRSALSVVAGSILATGLLAQTPAAPKVDFPAASPAATLKQRVGLTDIEVEYSRPSMKGRVVFGGLEPFGEIWRTGANSATKITFSTAVKFGGTSVPAGSYALFSLIGADQWTLILNQAPGKWQWGSYTYDAKNDIARAVVTPMKLTEPVETFTIEVNDVRDDSATLNLLWEKTRVPVKIEVDLSALIPQIEAAMATPNEKSPYVPAAMFYLDQNRDLKKALDWMDAAIALDPKAFYFIYRKGLIQEKMGDKEGALASARLSIEGANKSSGAIKDEYVRLNEALIDRVNGKAPAMAAVPAAAPARLSPPDTISQRIDGNRVTLVYSRPHSQDPKTGAMRKIWGGLVPYGEVWRTGANEATLLITQQAIVIGGVMLPGGGYTLYTLPAADGSAKLLINKKLGQWGADPYDQTQEVVRVDLKKESLPESINQFTMSIDKNPDGGGLIRLKWENTQYSVPFTLKK